MAEGLVSWSVVGVGVAGRARARAIGKDPRARLVAVWRGRFAAELGVPAVASFAEAVSRAEAVAICSPTSVHAAQARTVLEADRHALVEFPLATSVHEAQALFALARARSRILHVEHIELLDAQFVTLAAHVRTEMIRSVRCTFTRPGPAGATAHDLAFGNVARFHRLCGIAGPIGSVDWVHVDRGTLEVDVTFTSGATARCTFGQGPALPRLLHLDLRTVTDHWEQQGDTLKRGGSTLTLLGPSSLFVRDQHVATARILDGAEPYVSEERILHVLDVAERIAEGRVGPLVPR